MKGNTDDDYEIVDEDSDEVLEMGRAGLPFAQVPEWVALSSLSDQAFRLYVHLLMHVNQVTGDRRAWPGRSALARRMGYKKVDTVDSYLKELIEFGVLEKKRRRYSNGGWATNLYRIHVLPPEGYTGALTNAEEYARAEESTKQRQGEVPAGQTLPPKQGVPPTPETGGTPEPGGTYPRDPGQVAPEKGARTIRRETHEENNSPGGDESLRSSSPPGGRASAAPAPEATTGPADNAEPDALFDAAEVPPTGNDLHPDVEVRGSRRGGGRRRSAARATVFVDGWWPDEVTWRRATKECPELSESRLRHEVGQVILYSQGNRKAYKDHNLMWLKWVREEARRVRERAPRQREAVGGNRVYRNEDTWGPGGSGHGSWNEVNTRPVDGAEVGSVSSEDVAAAVAEQAAEMRRIQQRRNPWS